MSSTATKVLDQLGLSKYVRRAQSQAVRNVAAPLEAFGRVATADPAERPYQLLVHHVTVLAYDESVETGFMVDQIILALKNISSDYSSKMAVLAVTQVHLYELPILEQLRDALIVNANIPAQQQRSDE